jgi:hypothetical protein
MCFLTTTTTTIHTGPCPSPTPRFFPLHERKNPQVITVSITIITITIITIREM